MASRIISEIKQKKPLSGPELEVYLNIVRTADFLTYGVAELLKPHGLSPATYNVLRILRGAGEEGLTCGEIGERMLTRVPDVTRLLDRLEERNLLYRSRESQDRRVVRVRITPDGEELLASLDRPITQFHRRQLGHLGRERLALLIDLLEEARGGSEADEE